MYPIWTLKKSKNFYPFTKEEKKGIKTFGVKTLLVAGLIICIIVALSLSS